MLRDEIVTRPPGDLSPTLHVSQARPRSASTPHTLRSLYMKAQPRLAGDRRKPCRNGSGSDIPMECVTLLGQCVGPPDNTCDLLQESFASAPKGSLRGSKDLSRDKNQQKSLLVVRPVTTSSSSQKKSP